MFQFFILVIVVYLVYFFVVTTKRIRHTKQLNGPIYGYTNGSYCYLRVVDGNYQLFVSVYTELLPDATENMLSAHDGTNDLEIIKVRTKAEGKLVEEKFVISLSKGYLVQRVKSGIEIKVRCTGKAMITLPPEYLKEFLQTVSPFIHQVYN